MGETTEQIISHLPKEKTLMKILVRCIGVVIALIIFYLGYNYFTYNVYSSDVNQLGSDIEGVYLSSDGNVMNVKLTSLTDLENVTNVKFILKSGEQDYTYETSEGISELSYSKKISFMHKILGVKPDASYYDYSVDISKINGLESFKDVEDVQVYFEYAGEKESVEFGSADEIYKSVEDYQSNTATVVVKKSSSGGGGGGGSSSSATATCTPSCAGKTCGSDGCGGSCGVGCSGNQTCTNYVCVNVTQNVSCSPTVNPCGAAVCGTATNGTCGTVSCGSCSGGFNCNNLTGQCVEVGCSPTVNPCGAAVCGTATNGTCGTVSCGSCSSGYDCVSGSCVEDDGKNELIGWELDETNTGLQGDYSQLTLLDLTNPSDPDYGKGAMNWAGVPGYLRINKNQVIENRIINYSYYFDLALGNITIRNCLIQPTFVARGMPLLGIVNGTIEDSEIDASLIPAPNVSAGISAQDSQILRNNIHEMSTGIQIYGVVGNSHAEGNYVHGLRYVPPAHVDGITIRMATGTNCTLINNRIVTDVLCTSALFIQPSTGPITSTVFMQGNLFEGTSFNFAMTGSTYTITGNNMSMVNNRFNPYPANGAPSYGAVGISNGGPALKTWSENYFYNSTNSPNYNGSIVNQ